MWLEPCENLFTTIKQAVTSFSFLPRSGSSFLFTAFFPFFFFFFLVVFESVVLNVYLLGRNCDVCGFARGFTFLWGFVTFTQENDNS